MIDILFSHSYYYQLDPKQWKIKKPFPPLGTIYAASYMRTAGYRVDLFDTNLLNSSDAIVSELSVKKPKYLVLYDDYFNYLTKMCLTTMREASFKMIKNAKKNGCTIIVCGSDATDHSELYLDNGADVILQGEGEVSLKELIDTLERNEAIETVNGLMFKKDDEYHKTLKRSVIQKLDDLPLPAWDLVDIQAYKDIWKLSGASFRLNIATTRGCPYKCNWCAKPIYGNRYNSHSPSYIINHINYLKKHFDVTNFWMCDDIFGLKPGWVQEFKSLLQEHQLTIDYYIQSRADLLLKEDTIDALAASGLSEVWIGAESGSQKILDAMDKGITLEQIHTATRLLQEHGVKVAFFIQYGYLGETKHDVQLTIKMIKDLVPDNLGISVAYPLPGTKFYEKVKEDLGKKANWKDSDDLAMLFKGTYNSDYYKKLYRYTHKEYRKSQGLIAVKQLISNPLKFNFRKIRAILLAIYYSPSILIDKLYLNKWEVSHE